jgi:hypothetical protein
MGRRKVMGFAELNPSYQLFAPSQDVVHKDQTLRVGSPGVSLPSPLPLLYSGGRLSPIRSRNTFSR